MNTGPALCLAARIIIRGSKLLHAAAQLVEISQLAAEDANHRLDLFRPEVSRVHARIVAKRSGQGNGPCPHWLIENRANRLDGSRFPRAFVRE